MTVLTMSSYVGDPRASDPGCAADIAASGQTTANPAQHPDVVSSAGEVHSTSGPLHGLQPVSSGPHLLHLPEEQLPNLQPHVLQTVQSLPHLHEPYHTTSAAVATITTTGDVYALPNCGYTSPGVLMEYSGAAYDVPYYGSSPYTEMVSPPPSGPHTDVKPTEEDLWHYRQRTESTQSYASSCCGPYDSPTPVNSTTTTTTTTTPNATGDLGFGGLSFEPQPSTSHDTNNSNSSRPAPVVDGRLGTSQSSAKAGRPTRIKREPLCSESSGTGAGPDDVARRLRRRERNKVAAAKCRNKKKKQQEQLNKDHSVTRQQNDILQREVANLKAKVKELRDQLANHNCCLIGVSQISIPASSVPGPTPPPVRSMVSTASSPPAALGYTTNPANATVSNEVHHQLPAPQQLTELSLYSTQNAGEHQAHLTQQPQQVHPDEQLWTVQDNPWRGQMMG